MASTHSVPITFNLSILSSLALNVLKQFAIMGPCTGEEVRKELGLEYFDFISILGFLEFVGYERGDGVWKIEDKYKMEVLLRYD